MNIDVNSYSCMGSHKATMIIINQCLIVQTFWHNRVVSKFNFKLIRILFFRIVGHCFFNRAIINKNDNGNSTCENKRVFIMAANNKWLNQRGRQKKKCDKIHKRWKKIMKKKNQRRRIPLETRFQNASCDTLLCVLYWWRAVD